MMSTVVLLKVSRKEMELVGKIVHKMLDGNKENYIQIPTGGTLSRHI